MVPVDNRWLGKRTGIFCVFTLCQLPTCLNLFNSCNNIDEKEFLRSSHDKWPRQDGSSEAPCLGIRSHNHLCSAFLAMWCYRGSYDCLLYWTPGSVERGFLLFIFGSSINWNFCTLHLASIHRRNLVFFLMRLFQYRKKEVKNADEKVDDYTHQ